MTYVVVSSGHLRGLGETALPPDRAAFLAQMRPIVTDAQRKVDDLLNGNFSWLSVWLHGFASLSTRAIRADARNILRGYKSRLALIIPSLEEALRDDKRTLDQIAEPLESYFGDFGERIHDVVKMHDITLTVGFELAFRNSVRAALDTAKRIAKAGVEEVVKNPIGAAVLVGALAVFLAYKFSK